MTAAMHLQDLFRGIAKVDVAHDVMLRGLHIDSRQVARGDAFVALQGGSHHGIEFAPAARARGAAIVLAEAPAPAGSVDPGPTVWVQDLRQHLGALAARFFGHPGQALHLTGVTGTNGKTSVVQLLAQAFASLGRQVASIGTLGAGLHGDLDAGQRTTPDVIRVHELLARFRDQGAQEVAMEVSSHALDQQRVNGVPFRIAVFTNLSRDHLDYHPDMAAYAAAKAKLFAWPSLQTAVLNLDDAQGRALAGQLPDGVECLGFAIDHAEAAVRADQLHSHADGFDFTLHTPWGSRTVHSRLLGRFNVANVLAVVACLGASGFDLEHIARVLPDLQPIRGRMNRVGGGNQPLVVVDYAHTPQALQVALASLRPHCHGRLLCVFGAGGERDAGKRPRMGALAEAGADELIITDDNPRGEDGDAIVADIQRGLQAPARASIVRDRRRAIAEAIERSGNGDVILVAGKGHETTQQDRDGMHPFDDLAVASSLLAGAAPC